MNKIILVILVFSLTGFAKPYKNVDDMFQPTNKKVMKKIRRAVKDQFGWDKDIVIKRLNEKVYTETQIKQFIKKIAKEEVKKDFDTNVKKIQARRIKILTIAIRKISVNQDWKEKQLFIKTIKSYSPYEVAYAIKELKAKELRMFRIKTLKNFTPEELEIFKSKILTPEAIQILLKNVPIEKLKENVLTIVDLSKPKKCKSLDDRLLVNALRKRDFKKINEILSEFKIRQRKEIMKAITETKPFWIEAIWGKNAYFINQRKEVHNGDVVIVDVSMLESRLKFAEFLQRNKGKRYAIQLGYEVENNFETRNREDYKRMAKDFSDFYFLAKSIDPGVVVGITVCMTMTWREWVDSMSFKPDVIFLWNIYKTKANFRKIAKIFRGYKVVIAGMNVLHTEGDIPNPARYMTKIRKAGLYGSIWYQ